MESGPWYPYFIKDSLPCGVRTFLSVRTERPPPTSLKLRNIHPGFRNVQFPKKKMMIFLLLSGSLRGFRRFRGFSVPVFQHLFRKTQTVDRRRDDSSRAPSAFSSDIEIAHRAFQGLRIPLKSNRTGDARLHPDQNSFPDKARRLQLLPLVHARHHDRPGLQMPPDRREEGRARRLRGRRRPSL